MRILASLILTLTLVGCTSQTPEVSEMPSAQVEAPQAENTQQPQAEASENDSTENASEDSAQPSEAASAETEKDSVESSPSPSVTKTSEATPTKTTEPSPTPTKTTEPSPTPTKAPAGYTMAQVAQKNSQSACWVVIEAMVYDLTEWIRQHPGGRGAILSLCGTDGTTGFNSQHSGRSGPASALRSYLLGPLSN